MNAEERRTEALKAATETVAALIKSGQYYLLQDAQEQILALARVYYEFLTMGISPPTKTAKTL